MVNRNYVKGYSSERYCSLTLEYHRYHVKKNYRSLGIEDLVAASNGKQNLLIQVKNTKKGRLSMTNFEKEILRRHAALYNMTPVYLYKEGRKHHWIDLSTGKLMEFEPYTDEWYQERKRVKDLISKMKKEKGGSKTNEYILQNWEKVKWFIC